MALAGETRRPGTKSERLPEAAKFETKRRVKSSSLLGKSKTKQCIHTLFGRTNGVVIRCRRRSPASGVINISRPFQATVSCITTWLRAGRVAGHGQEEICVVDVPRLERHRHAACVAVLVLAVSQPHRLQPRRGSPDGIDSTDSRPRKPPLPECLRIARQLDGARQAGHGRVKLSTRADSTGNQGVQDSSLQSVQPSRDG